MVTVVTELALGTVEPFEKEVGQEQLPLSVFICHKIGTGFLRT